MPRMMLNANVARHEAAVAELCAYDKDTEKLDSDYFQLAGGVHERENSVVVAEVKKVNSADALKPTPA